MVEVSEHGLYRARDKLLHRMRRKTPPDLNEAIRELREIEEKEAWSPSGRWRRI